MTERRVCVGVTVKFETWLSEADAEMLNDPSSADPDRWDDLLNDLRGRLLDVVPRAQELDWEVL